MSLWLERFYELSHYNTLLEEAEQHRLTHPHNDPWRTMHRGFCRVMYWLGDRLSFWGNHLQSRYGNGAHDKSRHDRSREGHKSRKFVWAFWN